MADLLVVVELEAVPGITKGIRPGLFLGQNKLLMYVKKKKAKSILIFKYHMSQMECPSKNEHLQLSTGFHVINLI